MIKDMKTRISKLNIDFDFEAYWEIIYLILLAFFVGMRFLLSTMFTIYWPKYFYRTLTVIGVVLVLLHLMMAKDISKKEIAAMLVVTFVFMMSHYVSGYDFLVDLLILILGAYRVNFRNILKTYIAVWSVLLVVTIVGAMTGAAENLVYYQGESGERVRMALGICYPTDLAAYVAFLMFTYVCVRDEYITYLEIGMMAALAGAVYYITDARTDFILMLLLVFVMLIAKKYKKKLENYRPMKFAQKIIVIVPTMICVLIWLMTIIYRGENKILSKIDSVLSGRLWLGQRAFNDYGISLFGQYVHEKGAGGSTEWDWTYYFIDSSYISIGIKYGIVFLLLVLIGATIILKKNIWLENYMISIVFVFVLFQSVIEHHFIQYWYNPFLVLYFSKEINENRSINVLKYKKRTIQCIDLN